MICMHVLCHFCVGAPVYACVVHMEVLGCLTCSVLFVLIEAESVAE